MGRLLSFASVLALLVPIAAAGCSSGSSDSTDPDESELATAGFKTLARGLEHPAGLLVTDKHVYFSTNHFVASGDPELDQEFAYWAGKYSRVPLAGGAREAVMNDGVTRVRLAGKTLLASTASSCWIASVNTSAATLDSKTVYTDPDCSGEGGGEPVGFEISQSSLAVVRESGEVKVGKLDGSGMAKIGEFKFADYAGFIQAEALADGKIFAVTHRGYTDHQNNNKVLPQTIFSLSLAGGTPKTVHEFGKDESDVSNFVSDGQNVFWSQDKKLYVLPAGQNDPKLVSEDFGSIGELAVDGKDAYVADYKRGNIYVVKNAAGAASAPKKLIEAKGVETMAVADGKLYFGTHAIDGRKAVGIIGAIPL